MYRSPLHIIHYFYPDGSADIDLQRLQKQYAVEFNLHGLISINGTEYSKNEVFKIIDEIKTSGLHIHRSIFYNKAVLNFLESLSSLSSAEPIREFCELMKESKSNEAF